jgi:hypothetical protein
VSDAGSPPPPPPPPNLTPPPGYVAYTPTPGAAVPLRRVGGLRTAIGILLAVYALAAGISIAVTPTAIDAADEFLSSDRGSTAENDFLEKLAPFTIASVLVGLSMLAIVVLSMIWLYRIVSNHRAVGRRTSWSPGWAIGGWFLPPLIVYAIPMLVLRESWKASDPSSTPGDEGWRQSPVNPIVYVWWVVYGLVPIVFVITGITFQAAEFSRDIQDLARSMRDDVGFTVAQSAVSIVGALLWALLVRGLTARHTALTGEGPRR